MNNNIDYICDKVKTQGYFICRNYVSNIEKIDNEFENIINDESNNFDKNLGKNKCLRSNLNNNYLNKTNFPNICNEFNNDFITQICKKFDLNINTDKKETLIHKDYEVRRTNNNYPHFDRYRKLKFYLCVNDMNITNGCFKVLPNTVNMVNKLRKKNTHKNTGNNFFNIFNKNHKFFVGKHIEISDLTPLEANAGDLIIFDTNCIHAGGDNFEDGKFRKVIRLHIVLR